MPEIDYASGDSPSEVLNSFWRETLSGIRNGRWGSDIRAPIETGIRQLVEEKDIEESEIEEALETIVTSIYGEEVRMAIHDALLLIHNESGGGESPERFYYVDQIIRILEGIAGSTVKFGVPVAWPDSGSVYFTDNSSDAESEITISASSAFNCIGVMTVLYEQGDTPAITDSTGTSWVLLHRFTPSGENLVCAVYSAQVSSGDFTVTLTKENESARFHATLRCFYGKVQAIKLDADTMDALSSTTYTPASDISAGDNRYYILAYTAITPATYMLAVDPNGGQYTHNLHYDLEECHLYHAGKDPDAPEENPQKGMAPTFSISGSTITDWATIGLRLF